ncbi:MAG: GNAT family N-acetyltransferase [Desulfovermiculus sp.]
MTELNQRKNREYSFTWHDSILGIKNSEWDTLDRALPTPFLSWEWLRLLETSGSVRPETGWQPRHLAVFRADRLVAAAPLFIKTHSDGEFVFDRFFAQVAQSMDLAYYPKLVGMSPFTPIGAYQFLVDKDENQDRLIRVVQQEIGRFCQANSLSGCHYHFVDPDWGRKLQGLGFHAWTHPGFAWQNKGYEGFEDFLARFRSNRRKSIKKERKSLASQGITCKALTGEDIREEHLAWMYDFYVHTNQRYFPWSCKYLTRDFFLGLEDDLKDHLLLLAAYRRGQTQPLGMSMLVYKGEQLFGRYWGGVDGVPFLHFNLCYYEPIQWAIHNRMQRFDPGMGGEHKLYRGFELVPNYSLHRIYVPEMQHVLAVSLHEVNTIQERRIMELNRETAIK